MRLPKPKVIAIDDVKKHLDGLTEGLNSYGTTCLPIHFTGRTGSIHCPQVRVMFADLHLVAGNSHEQNFAVIGGLIEKGIKPSGPYVIVLWTKYPDQAAKLHEYLTQRLKGVAKPLSIKSLDKGKYLNSVGNVRSPRMLVGAIDQVIAEQPQIGALLNWEERVSGAAADAVSSITQMAELVESGNIATEVGRLSRSLAIAAVGKNHVQKDRFGAVNEALLPMLADRVSALRPEKSDNSLWLEAFGDVDSEPQLKPREAARLNRSLHIALPAHDIKPSERGTVAWVAKTFLAKKSESLSRKNIDEAMEKQFLCRKPPKSNPGKVYWVIVQTQAACDYAQKHPGSLPFHVGLCLPESWLKKNGRAPASLWRSPIFEYNEKPHYLHVNALFPLSLSGDEVDQSHVLFRLREQLLNDLIYHIHSHGARPGIIDVRAKSTK